MRELSNIRHELAVRIHDLPAEQLKKAVLQWLDNKEGNLWDLEATLTRQTNQSQSNDKTADKQNNFAPPTEAEMVAQSLEALAEFRQTGQSISHQTIESWAQSLASGERIPLSHML